MPIRIQHPDSCICIHCFAALVSCPHSLASSWVELFKYLAWLLWHSPCLHVLACVLTRVHMHRVKRLPSHSLVSVLLQMYITSTIKTKSSRLAKPVLCLGTLCTAFLTGLNRVSEYRNHCSDVIAGFILGTAVALFLVGQLPSRALWRLHSLSPCASDPSLVRCNYSPSIMRSLAAGMISKALLLSEIWLHIPSGGQGAECLWCMSRSTSFNTGLQTGAGQTSNLAYLQTNVL